MEDLGEQKPDLLATGLMEVDEETGRQLKEAGKWGKTLAIITIAIATLVIIFFVVYGKVFAFNMDFADGAEAAGVLTAIALMIILFGIFILSLFRFSRGMQDGIDNQDTEAFEKGLKGLKTYFIFIVIASALVTLSSLIKLFN